VALFSDGQTPAAAEEGTASPPQSALNTQCPAGSLPSPAFGSGAHRTIAGVVCETHATACCAHLSGVHAPTPVTGPEYALVPTPIGISLLLHAATRPAASTAIEVESERPLILRS